MDGYEAPMVPRMKAARESLRWAFAYRWHHVAPALRHRVERLLGHGADTGSSPACMPGPYAAMARTQLDRLPELLARRLANVRALSEALRGIAGIELPQAAAGVAVTRFMVRTPGHRWLWQGDGIAVVHPLALQLRAQGIECAAPYQPLHRHARYLAHATRALPRTEAIVPELVALPVLGKLTPEDIERIAGAVRGFAQRA